MPAAYACMLRSARNHLKTLENAQESGCEVPRPATQAAGTHYLCGTCAGLCLLAGTQACGQVRSPAFDTAHDNRHAMPMPYAEHSMTCRAQGLPCSNSPCHGMVAQLSETDTAAASTEGGPYAIAPAENFVRSCFEGHTSSICLVFLAVFEGLNLRQSKDDQRSYLTALSLRFGQ